MKRIKLLIFIGIMGWISYIFLKTIIGNALLKNGGKCIAAVLINEQNRVRSHRATLLYEFKYNGNSYKGNSLEEDLTKIGDSVCVIYLESFPGINRPIKYFNNETVTCSCR
jgi:hypothetical protein